MSATEERTFRTKAPYHGDRVPTLFHLRQHVRDALDLACDAENKTLSALGEELIVPVLIKAGYLEPPTAAPLPADGNEPAATPPHSHPTK